ncbi:hypothetical protein PV327_010748 [Microctonus hyperodae]|uniref:Transferrin-like domain-containing protein n=1 Tax=Microctonus hyperodae TaxID=165561 RepID=A0AA39C832_MICHY|nr:hypothetical protein PV327_010748 [Microctonus hyperodae]
MPGNSQLYIALRCIFLFILCQTSRGQYYNTHDGSNNNPSQNNTVTWCTVSPEEQKKCLAFAEATDNAKQQFNRDYISIKCKQAFNKEECMNLLDQEIAHLTSLDAGEVFIAGRYHSLIPIMQEVHESGISDNYAVAVIKKDSLPDVTSLHNLRGKKACFAGVGKLAGWITPLYTLMQEGGLEVIDCNNHVKSTIKYFGPSCAINSLIDRYNPLGDNSNQLCKLCIGEIPGGICTSADPYADYEGAFKCLVEAGEIAFLVHTTVGEMTSTNFQYESLTKEHFQLLCRDGTRRSVDNYRDCNWGNVPSRAIVTSSATGVNTRRLYQRFLEKSARIFGKKSPTDNVNNNNYYNKDNDNINNRSNDWNENRDGFDNRYNDNYNNYESFNRNNNEYNNENDPNNQNSYGNFNNYSSNNYEPPGVQSLDGFRMFESAPTYGHQHNLIFSDAARDFVPLIEKDQTYTHYLGTALNAILGVRKCPISTMKLCVTSDPEKEKCAKMKIALKAQLLKPELECYRGTSQIHCMQAIREGVADIAVFDAGDIYTAGQFYNLIPFMSEIYNLPTPEYYVVAVAKESDPSTQLTYLKDKYTCHTGINTAAGWIYPMAYLLSNEWIRGYGCDSIHAAAEYFTKSCVPGALSVEYNVGLPYDNMCDLCHGTSSHLCRRDASEDFYGYTGAFRCLVEGGGDVAFVKHTTVFENTDSKRSETWARNTFIKDFQLLCPDGTRRASDEYHSCNLGKVKANAIVTRGKDQYDNLNHTEINAFINLLLYTQQFYGRKNTDEYSFSMFSSEQPYSDLIFQDAAQQLIVIPTEERKYSRYLGRDFMRAQRIVNCNAGAAAIDYSIFTSVFTIVLAFIFSR